MCSTKLLKSQNFEFEQTKPKKQQKTLKRTFGEGMRRIHTKKKESQKQNPGT